MSGYDSEGEFHWDEVHHCLKPSHVLGEWKPNPPNDPLPQEPTLTWTYEGADTALMLFTASVERFGMTFPSGSSVLELGCAESDWLERMHAMDPSLKLVGVDARSQDRRAEGFTLIQGSAMDTSLFEANSFDRVCLLGSLEHFGLGFYGDPAMEYGDLQTLENVCRWLRPGGFVYFDVPCQPTSRVSENRHFRSYAPNELPWPAATILRAKPYLAEVARGYSYPEPMAGQWVPEPTEDRVPYWFVAVLAQKVA